MDQMPSLNHMTFIKVAITLFKQDAIGELLSECPSTGHWTQRVRTGAIYSAKKSLKKIEDYVEKKVDELPLPDSLKLKLMGFVEVVGWQLLKWRQFLFNYKMPDLFKYYFNKFYWTPQGTIDKKKSIELLLKDERIDIKMRYELACEYCLEDHIRTLREQIPLEAWRPSIQFQPLITEFWGLYLTGKLHELEETIRYYCRCTLRSVTIISPYEYMFRISLSSYSDVTTRYFFQKLTHKEKQEVLLPCTLDILQHIDEGIVWGERFAEKSCFLFYNMNEEQRRGVLESHPYDLLSCFLIWPSQSSFMEVAKCVPDTPQCHFSYCNLLRKISSQITHGLKDYNYRKLLLELWYKGPDYHKEYVTENYASDLLLSTVFKIDNKGSFQLIVRDMSVCRKRKHSSDEGTNLSCIGQV